MATFTDTVHVNRSPVEVFHFFSDLSRLAQSIKHVQAMEAVDQKPLRAGSKVRQTRQVGGKETTSILEITTYEPDRAFAITTVKGPITATYHYTLHKQNDGTRLEFEGRIAVKGVLKLLTPWLVNVIKKEDQDILPNIKRLVEQS